MPKSTKKLKKLDINLLEARLKGQSTILTSISKLPIGIETDQLLSNQNLLIFLGGLALFLIIMAINLFLFISNLSLKAQYKRRLAEIKPYNKELETLNKEVSLLAKEYNKINSTVSSFSDMNHIFSRYYNIYKSSIGAINYILYSATENYNYVSNISFNTSGRTVPSSFNITSEIESPSYNDNILSNINKTDGCYDIGIKNICIKSINVDKKMKINNYGYSYFDTKININGEYVENKTNSKVLTQKR